MKFICFFTASLFALLVPLMSAPAWAATYEIDGTHSSVGFKVRHLGISNVRGEFLDFSGTFDFDPNNVAASKAAATISVKSVNTRNDKRDDHLRSDDFFNADKFPSMSFTSSKVEKVSDTQFKVTGDLSLHGVSKPVVLDVTYTGQVTDPWGNEKAGFVATTLIDRRVFGLTWSKLVETGALVVGNEVEIELEIAGIKKK